MLIVIPSTHIVRRTTRPQRESERAAH